MLPQDPGKVRLVRAAIIAMLRADLTRAAREAIIVTVRAALIARAVREAIIVTVKAASIARVAKETIIVTARADSTVRVVREAIIVTARAVSTVRVVRGALIVMVRVVSAVRELKAVSIVMVKAEPVSIKAAAATDEVVLAVVTVREDLVRADLAVVMADPARITLAGIPHRQRIWKRSVRRTREGSPRKRIRETRRIICMRRTRL